MVNKHWLLSIDAGGTKTEGLLLDRNNLRGITMRDSGANPNIYQEESVVTITSMVKKLIEYRGIQTEDIVDCIIGIAGYSLVSFRNQIEKSLKNLIPEGCLHLISDAQLAHHSIWGTNPGISLVVGTGSIAVGFDNKGKFYRTGGLGYYIGDEGSGFWLGKTVITQLIANERSNNEDMISIRDECISFLGATNFDSMVKHLSTDKKNVSLLAGLAPVILRETEKGNFFTRPIIMQGAESLANLVITVSDKMGITTDKIRIGISGSVISNSKYYRLLIEEYLLFNYTKVKWLLPQFPPVYGGLILASDPVQLRDFHQINIQNV